MWHLVLPLVVVGVLGWLGVAKLKRWTPFRPVFWDKVKVVTLDVRAFMDKAAAFDTVSAGVDLASAVILLGFAVFNEDFGTGPGVQFFSLLPVLWLCAVFVEAVFLEEFYLSTLFAAPVALCFGVLSFVGTFISLWNLLLLANVALHVILAAKFHLIDNSKRVEQKLVALAGFQIFWLGIAVTLCLIPKVCR
jgi:hypothetical protein